MTEKQFEEFVRDAARDYNEVPETPRDAMWARIDEVRRARRVATKVVSFGSPWVRWGVGIAAALVLGIGIGMNLDRLLSDGRAGSPAITAEQPGQGGDGEGDVLRLVAMGHMSQSEAFLTMFRNDVQAGRIDDQTAGAARELLTTTRLLQSSSVYADPRMGELLDDLELILVQIAQLNAGDRHDDADLVAQGMEQRGVLLKLRAAAPAGPMLQGIQGVL